MDAAEFERITGSAPKYDDLERVNCHEAGKAGHTDCGLCVHGKPRFLPCEPCSTVARRRDKAIENILVLSEAAGLTFHLAATLLAKSVKADALPALQAVVKRLQVLSVNERKILADKALADPVST